MILLLAGIFLGFVIRYRVVPKGGEKTHRRVLREEELRWSITDWPLGLEVKPETIEFLSLELVQKGNVWVGEKPLDWVVEYECDARSTGIGTARINDSEVVPIEPSFGRMFFRLELNAYTGQLNSMEARSVGLPQPTTLYRSISVLEFRECDMTLGDLTCVFNIFDVNEDMVSMALTVSFTSPYLSMLESVDLRTALLVGVFGESIVRAMMPTPPVNESSLKRGEIVVFAYGTFNLSMFGTPIVAVGYGISPVELKFSNGSTVLLEEFLEGRCRVIPQATLRMVNGVEWGLAPFWEGDYEYSPGLVFYRLDELKGEDLWRKITIDIDKGSYSVEKR